MTLEEIFQKIDGDNSGQLDMREFKRFVSQSGLEWPDNVAELFFKRFDADGNGSISFKEFQSFVVRLLRAHTTLHPCVQ